MPLIALRPRARIELGPVVPALLWWKRGEMTAARPRRESFFHQFLFVPLGLFAAKLTGRIELLVHKRARRASGRSAPRALRRRRWLRLERRVLQAVAAARRAATE